MPKLTTEQFELLQKAIEFYAENVGDWQENCILDEAEYVIEYNYVE